MLIQNYHQVGDAAHFVREFNDLTEALSDITTAAAKALTEGDHLLLAMVQRSVDDRRNIMGPTRLTEMPTRADIDIWYPEHHVVRVIEIEDGFLYDTGCVKPSGPAVPVTYETLLAAIHAEVEAEGTEFIYRAPTDLEGNCVYVSGDAASCLLGRAFHRLGVPLDRLAPYDLIAEGMRADGVLDALNMTGVVSLPPADAERAAIMSLARNTQEAQDLGAAWGEAVQRGENESRALLAADTPVMEG